MKANLRKIGRMLASSDMLYGAVLWWRYREERRLLQPSETHGAPSASGRSVLFFTVHKCASTYTPLALEYLNRKYLELRPVDMAGFFYRTGSENTHAAIQRHSESIFRPRGYLYAPLRRPLDIRNISDYRTIVMVRDPRDVLTSLYYSVAYSHSLPTDATRRAEYLSRREEVARMDIDGYVRSRAAQIHEVYSGYAALATRANATVLRYETMVTRFASWAQALAGALGIELNDTDIRELGKMGGFDRATEEQPHRHIRQRSPGDHARKLQPSTIEYLDRELESELAAFGYDSAS